MLTKETIGFDAMHSLAVVNFSILVLFSLTRFAEQGSTGKTVIIGESFYTRVFGA